MIPQLSDSDKEALSKIGRQREDVSAPTGLAPGQPEIFAERRIVDFYDGRKLVIRRVTYPDGRFRESVQVISSRRPGRHRIKPRPQWFNPKA